MNPIVVIKDYLENLRNSGNDSIAALAWIDALEYVLVVFGEMRIEDTRLYKEVRS